MSDFVTVIGDTDEFHDRLEAWVDQFRDRLEAHLHSVLDEMPDLGTEIDSGEWSHERFEEWIKGQAALFVEEEEG